MYEFSAKDLKTTRAAGIPASDLGIGRTEKKRVGHIENKLQNI
jgi:hypothetical protein